MQGFLQTWPGAWVRLCLINKSVHRKRQQACMCRPLQALVLHALFYTLLTWQGTRRSARRGMRMRARAAPRAWRPPGSPFCTQLLLQQSFTIPCFLHCATEQTCFLSLGNTHSPSFTVARQYAAIRLPSTLCVHELTAHGAATSGLPKCRPASTAPSVAFCIPTSMELVRAILSDRPRALETA